jgi:hypothetical protein
MMTELGRRIRLALALAIVLAGLLVSFHDAAAKDGTEPKLPASGKPASGAAGAGGTQGAGAPAAGTSGAAPSPAPTPAPGASGACGSDVSGRAKCIKEFAEALKAACEGPPAPFKALCDAFCLRGPNEGVPVCALASDDTATLAVAHSAWSDFESVKRLIRTELEALQGKDAKLAAGEFGRVLKLTGAGTLTGASPADAAADFAVRALQGLGKLIADRAKAEAIGWVLDQLGEEACPAKDDTDDTGSAAERRNKLVKRELAVHWIPALCRLARQQRLGKYGGGAALLRQLKAAIQSDLAGWPGAAAGTVPATLFWFDARGASIYLPGCRSKNLGPWQKDFCEALDDVRFSTRDTVRSVIEGQDPVTALVELGASFDEVNTRQLGTQPKKVTSVRLQMVACSLTLPPEFNAIYDPSEAWQLPSSGAAAPPPTRAQASVLAALVQGKPCWHLVGKGFRVDNWKKWKTENEPLSSVVASVERISTIVRLRDQVGAHVDELIDHWKQVVAAKKKVDEARDGLEAAFAKLEKAEVPDLSKAKVDDPDSVLRLAESYRSATAGLIVGPAQTRLAKALVLVGEATTRVGKDVVSIAGGLTELGVALDDKDTVAARLKSAHAALEDLAAAFAAIRSVLEQQYAPLASEAVAFLERRASSEGSGAANHSESTASRLSRVIALITAIASARDSDGVAEAIEAVAAPVGAWRGKGESNSRTLSLTAHAGVFGAREWRKGTYGVIREDMSPHWQVPALALPVGVEVAWGFDCPIASPFALFFPLLDPAAFLQYDAEKEGKLPGASVKTALSPGVGLRFGIRNTPFSVIPQFVYRPGFRQWDSNLGGTGADAYQVGVLLGVDVTLFQLSRKGGS